MSERATTQRWERLGRIVEPSPGIPWLAGGCGAAFARPLDESARIAVYVSGRDALNRSRIGRVDVELGDPPRVLRIDAQPLLELGELGTFDENGTSYPWIVERDGGAYLYYTGWMPSVRTPFQNHLGVAREVDGRFERVSRAPILPRTDAEPFGVGSVCVLPTGADSAHAAAWTMWYTAFLGWDARPDGPRHRYHIRRATSADALTWQRDGEICVDFADETEFAIAKPSVLRAGSGYRQWYSRRGDRYRLGYAESPDGRTWTRLDDRAGFEVSSTGWDSEAICYPHVFEALGAVWMLYCGNGYGRTGVGLARLVR